MKLRDVLWVVALGLSALPPVQAAEPPPQIPVDVFVRDTAYSDLIISPDGKKLAALSKWKGRLNLYVIDLATKKPALLTGLTSMDIAGVSWVGSNRLVFTCKDEGYATGGIFAIDADGSHATTLAESVRQQGSKGKRYRDTSYLGRYGQSEEEVLVVSNERRELEPDVYRMNVRNGIKTLVARNPGNVQEWLADHTGAVRLGKGELGRERFIVYRDGPTGDFREIWRGDFMKGEVDPVSFDHGDRQIYVTSSVDRDTAAICLLDPATGKVGPTLFENPTYDADSPVQLAETGELLGFAYEGEKPAYVWTDPNYARLQKLLDQELPDTLNRVVSRSKDRQWMVVLAYSARELGAYYLLNTKELSLEKLVRRADWFDPRQMAEMKPITYTARDGRTIHGYLTLPVGRDPKNLPLVVNPHGGPWVRDEWGFNFEVQLLANRGYAVLQMNFRGSTGYGRSHLQAGYGQWGLAMQDDITDGVKWAVAQGIADPERVGIYGASYGGYAAMAGLAFTPDLYRCGVNYVGVTDISLLLDTIPKAWEVGRASLEAMTGDKKKDRERLEATSVIKHADQIHVPVFFAYGEADDRIDMHHATKLATQLRHNGVPVTWMSRANEGHGYRRWENKIAFYSELEEFLAANMGPKSEAFGQIGESKVVEMPATKPAGK